MSFIHLFKKKLFHKLKFMQQNKAKVFNLTGAAESAASIFDLT